MRSMLRDSAVLLFVLLLAGAAAANDRALGGIGVIEELDAARHVVTIDGRDYRVSASTVLLGREGERLRFEQLPAAEERDGELVGQDAATCSFEARGSRTPRTLEKLRLIEPPR